MKSIVLRVLALMSGVFLLSPSHFTLRKENDLFSSFDNLHYNGKELDKVRMRGDYLAFKKDLDKAINDAKVEFGVN